MQTCTIGHDEQIRELRWECFSVVFYTRICVLCVQGMDDGFVGELSHFGWNFILLISTVHPYSTIGSLCILHVVSFCAGDPNDSCLVDLSGLVHSFTMIYHQIYNRIYHRIYHDLPYLCLDTVHSDPPHGGHELRSAGVTELAPSGRLNSRSCRGFKSIKNR